MSSLIRGTIQGQNFCQKVRDRLDWIVHREGCYKQPFEGEGTFPNLTTYAMQHENQMNRKKACIYIHPSCSEYMYDNII